MIVFVRHQQIIHKKTACIKWILLRLRRLGKQLGLDGQDLLTFVSEREKARDEIEKLKIQVEKAKKEREQLRIQAEKAKEETQQLRIQTEKAKEETEQFKIQAEKETTVEIEKLKMYAEREARTQLEQEKLKEEYEIAMEKIKQDKSKEITPNMMNMTF